MTTNWLNQLGDRNPQLLRELRGRFQVRSVLATIGILAIGQILLVIFFNSLLPNVDNRYSSYCVNQANCVPDWPRWWGDLFKTLTYIIPYALYVPGAFALVNDIVQETQKGTLNFLRLSPRSSRSILLGKLIGVPILGYFSLLLLLPLHLVTGFHAGIPLGFLVSFYSGLLAWGALVFTVSMFAGFSGGTQHKVIGVGGASGLAIVVLIAAALIPSINFISSVTTWYNFGVDGLSSESSTPMQIKWAGIIINADPITPHIFLFANLAFLTYWLWRVLQRAFSKPTATTISKRQGYAIVVYALLLLIGFVITNVYSISNQAVGTAAFLQISILASAAIYGAIPLIFLLSTPRQMLLDWSSGRQEIALAQRAENLSPGKRRLEQIRDRVFGEKSPGFAAIFICALIAFSLLSLLLPFAGEYFSKAVLGLALSQTLVANYTLLVQLMLLLETPKRYVWAFGSLICAIVLPSFCAAIPGLNSLAVYFTPGLWISLSIPYGRTEASLFLAFVAWGVMLALLVVQGLILRGRLRRLGRSV